MADDDTVHSTMVDAAIDELVESGYVGTTRESVIERAGLKVPQARDMFPDKDTLMAATMAWMFGDLAQYVGSRVEVSSDGLPKVQAYIRGMTAYFYRSPGHLRVMAEVLGSGELTGQPGDRPAERRWQALADLLADGQRQGLLGSFDPKYTAIVIGGAIDGLIAAWTTDSDFDLLAATEELVGLVSALTAGAVFTQD